MNDFMRKLHGAEDEADSKNKMTPSKKANKKVKLKNR